MIVATLAPSRLGPLVGVGSEMGTIALYLFFATAGWAGGGLGALLAGGPVLLAFMLTLHATHLFVVVGLGRALRVGPRVNALFCTPHLLVGSNANIGGPATAPVLAIGSGWPSLVTPAMLVGNVGYAIGTPLCLLLHAFLTQVLL